MRVQFFGEEVVVTQKKNIVKGKNHDYQLFLYFAYKLNVNRLNSTD